MRSSKIHAYTGVPLDGTKAYTGVHLDVTKAYTGVPLDYTYALRDDDQTLSESGQSNLASVSYNAPVPPDFSVTHRYGSTSSMSTASSTSFYTEQGISSLSDSSEHADESTSLLPKTDNIIKVRFNALTL